MKNVSHDVTDLEDYQEKFKIALDTLIKQGDLKAVMNAIQDYEKIVPSDTTIMCMKAVILMMENNLDEGEQVLQQALTLDYTNYDLLYHLGYLYQLKDKKRLALGYYNLALLYMTSVELQESLLQSISELRRELTGSNRPLVSIVMLAYNKLDYTKLCLDSIYRYTMEVDYELIVVNNGSTDGTRECFDSLPGAKVIHLPENIGPVNGFNVGLQAATGKYTAGVCNDYIFTANWMENMLKCIESDESIGFVSPGSSNISNCQQINGTYNNLVEMQQFAKLYNVSAPEKWEERARLLPNVLMVRTDLLKQIGYYDPRFYFGEFADDDIAIRIRRAGYKLVYLRDTFVFHFGSITTGDNQRLNNSLGVSRKIFFDKHGLDAWDDTVFNPIIINNIILPTQKAVRILGINTACGASPLQLKNKLKESGASDVVIWNITEDEKYLFDLNTVSDKTLLTSISDFQNNYTEEKFDIIVFERGFENTQPLELVLENLKAVMAENGQLIIKANNPTYYPNIVQVLNARKMNQAAPVNNFLPKDEFIQILQVKGFKEIRSIGAKYDVLEQDQQIIGSLTGFQITPNLTLTEDDLGIANYYYFIK